MSLWTNEQRVRLALEEELISKELPHFYFRDRPKPGITSVRGAHISASDVTYSLCVRIPSGYPYEMPALYITSPKYLYDYKSKTIQSYGTSHRMHVWKPDWENYVKICHCKSEYWRSDYMILNVILKGFLWLEAYEAHRRTRKPIDAFSLTYD